MINQRSDGLEYEVLLLTKLTHIDNLEQTVKSARRRAVPLGVTSIRYVSRMKNDMENNRCPNESGGLHVRDIRGQGVVTRGRLSFAKLNVDECPPLVYVDWSFVIYSGMTSDQFHLSPRYTIKKLLKSARKTKKMT